MAEEADGAGHPPPFLPRAALEDEVEDEHDDDGEDDDDGRAEAQDVLDLEEKIREGVKKCFSTCGQ